MNKRVRVGDRWVREREFQDVPHVGDIREHEDGTQYYSLFRGWVHQGDASTVEEDE